MRQACVRSHTSHAIPLPFPHQTPAGQRMRAHGGEELGGIRITSARAEQPACDWTGIGAGSAD